MTTTVILLYLFSKKLPTVPETVLKKRKRLEQIKASRAKALVAQKKVIMIWNCNRCINYVEYQRKLEFMYCYWLIFVRNDK